MFKGGTFQCFIIKLKKNTQKGSWGTNRMGDGFARIFRDEEHTAAHTPQGGWAILTDG